MKIVSTKYHLIFLVVLCLLFQNTSPWSLFKKLTETNEIMAVDYSPDGSMIVTGSKSKTFSLWSTSTYTKLFSSATLLDEVWSAKFSKDQTKVAVGCKGGFFYIFATTSPYAQLYLVNSVFSDVQELDFSWNSSKLVVCGGQVNANGIKIWDVATWTISFSDLQTSFHTTVKACKFAKDGSFAGAASDAKVVSYTSTTSVRWTSTDGSAESDLDFSSDSSILVVTDNTVLNKNIYTYTVGGAGGNPKSTVSSGQKMEQIAYSKLDTDYAVADDLNNVYVYNGTAGQLASQLSILTDLTNAANDLRYSYDDAFLAVASKDTNLYIYKRTLAITCKPECATCNSTTYCLTCFQGNYFSAGSCLPCVANCTACTTILCDTCNAGFYYLSASNSCINCSVLKAQCILCTNVTCLTCSSGYFYNSVSTNCEVCSSALPGCLSCSTSLVCSNCSNGYYLNSSGCLSCGVGCSSCSNSGICANCSIGFYYESSNNTCMTCNCPSCTSAIVCLTCQPFQYLSLGTCLLCNNSISYCQSCNSSTCLTCSNYYYLHSNGSCDACSFYGSTCLTCNSNACVLCSNQSTLQSGVCTLCSSLIVNCVQCENSSICLECNEGFFIDNSSSCSSCSVIDSCKICSNDTSCTTCFDGFEIYSSQKCVLSSSNNTVPLVQIVTPIVVGSLLLIFGLIACICWRRKHQENQVQQDTNEIKKQNQVSKINLTEESMAPIDPGHVNPSTIIANNSHSLKIPQNGEWNQWLSEMNTKSFTKEVEEEHN